MLIKKRKSKIAAKTIRKSKSTNELAQANGEPILSLRPGVLVSLSCRMSGGVVYERKDIDTKREGSAEIAEWETTRRIASVREYKQAVRVRNTASNLIRAQCIRTPFGLVCLNDKLGLLTKAVSDARVQVTKHNQEAGHTFVNVYLVRGRIEQNDTEAMRAIGGELRTMLADMKAGILNGDARTVREMVAKSKQMKQMLQLSDKQEEVVSQAVKVARGAARAIVKRIEKEGEAKAKVLRDIDLKALDTNRFSWLEIEDD